MQVPQHKVLRGYYGWDVSNAHFLWSLILHKYTSWDGRWHEGLALKTKCTTPNYEFSFAKGPEKIQALHCLQEKYPWNYSARSTDKYYVQIQYSFYGRMARNNIGRGVWKMEVWSHKTWWAIFQVVGMRAETWKYCRAIVEGLLLYNENISRPRHGPALKNREPSVFLVCNASPYGL